MPLPKSVMLVDDDHDDYEIFLLSLQAISPDIDCLYYDSAREALIQLSDREMPQPDFLFIDLNIPGMDGKQLLQHLKTDCPHLVMPVIVYSTSILPADRERVLQLGADSFFIKPSLHTELVAQLKKIFEEKE